MANNQYVTIQQHQPLRTPAGWEQQEKAFVVQLDEIFDDIYKRFGRLRLEDMSKAFRKSFTDMEANLTVEHITTGVVGVDAWRFGKLVVVNVQDKTPGELWTVPTGYRPGATAQSVARDDSSGATARLAYGTGDYILSITGATNASVSYYGQIMWIINS